MSTCLIQHDTEGSVAACCELGSSTLHAGEAVAGFCEPGSLTPQAQYESDENGSDRRNAAVRRLTTAATYPMEGTQCGVQE